MAGALTVGSVFLLLVWDRLKAAADDFAVHLNTQGILEVGCSSTAEPPTAPAAAPPPPSYPHELERTEETEAPGNKKYLLFLPNIHVTESQLPGLEADDDENLQKYLDRSYWEERNKAEEVSSFSQESHPVVNSPSQVENSEENMAAQKQEFVLQAGETEDEKKQKEQKAKFLKNLSASLDIFANRMRANQGAF